MTPNRRSRRSISRSASRSIRRRSSCSTRWRPRAPALANYPTTVGAPALREAIAAWLVRRHRLPALDPATQVLPVLGSREALFAFAQTVVDASRPGATVVMPNPFYQIYEGAALLAGAEPYCVNAVARTRLRACVARRPGRRLGAHAARLRVLAGQSDGSRDDGRRMAAAVRAVRSPWIRDRGRRVLFGDLFRRGQAAAGRAGRSRMRWAAPDFRASCRSAACRSARMRRDCARATSPATPRSSRRSCCIAPITARRCRRRSPRRAWPRGATRRTCARNRAAYAAKFAALQPRLAAALPCAMPDAAFYLWAATPGDDAEFARRLYAEQAVTVLPGSYFARDAHGDEPGPRPHPDRARRAAGRVRRGHRPDRRWRVRLTPGAGRLTLGGTRLCPWALRRRRPRPVAQRPLRGSRPRMRGMDNPLPFPRAATLGSPRSGRASTTPRGSRSCSSSRSTRDSPASCRSRTSGPLWHPFVSTQCFGLAIAYAVNVASPWERTRPDPAAVHRRRDRHDRRLRARVPDQGRLHGAPGLHDRRARPRSRQVPGDLDQRVLDRPLRQPVLPAQVSRVPRGGGAAPHRVRAAPAREARARVRAEADAGAGRAALPVQHAGVGPVPHRDRPAAGVAPARSPARVPARRVAAAAQREHDARARRSSSPRPISTSSRCGWDRGSTSRSTRRATARACRFRRCC